MKTSDFILALAVAFFWGTNLVSNKFALEVMPPLAVVTTRFVLVVLFLLPFAKKPTTSLKDTLFLAIVFGIGFIGMSNLALNQDVLVSNFVIILQLSVPIAIIIARFWLKEPIFINQYIGILISFVGVAIAIGIPDFSTRNPAMLLAFVASTSAAVYTVKLRTMGRFDVVSLLLWVSVASALIAGTLSFIFEDFSPAMLIEAEPKLVYSLIYMSLGSSVIGTAGWFYIIQRYSVTKTMVFMMLVPIFGIASAVCILCEELTSNIMLGSFVTMIGIVLVNKKKATT
jgi:O-acetylserine/cysteine efflux transporter